MAYANGMGAPDAVAGWRFVPGHGASREAYRDEVRRWIALGARWIGGCCGTTPEYVADVRRLVDEAAGTRPR
jgi:S-methylmethionine-dependent homocysteine/selenocysteine methylase